MFAYTYYSTLHDILDELKVHQLLVTDLKTSKRVSSRSHRFQLSLQSKHLFTDLDAKSNPYWWQHPSNNCYILQNSRISIGFTTSVSSPLVSSKNSTLFSSQEQNSSRSRDRDLQKAVVVVVKIQVVVANSINMTTGPIKSQMWSLMGEVQKIRIGSDYDKPLLVLLVPYQQNSCYYNCACNVHFDGSDSTSCSTPPVHFV